MKPAFLTGENIYLRAMVIEDKDRATAWYQSAFPVNAIRAEKFLRDEHKETWMAKRRYYAICRNEDDRMVGGIKTKTHERRVINTFVHIAPHLSRAEADSVKAQALELLVPWLSQEHEFMVVTVELPADETESVAMAEQLGMDLGVRLRRYCARPGDRVDLLIYQALNPRWEVADA